MDKFRYQACAGCGEMIDEAQGEIAVFYEDDVYCRYCAVPDDDMEDEYEEPRP